MSEEIKIKSPCRLICKYNTDSICVGCYRSKAEIIGWINYSNEEKLQVLENIKNRRGEDNPAKRFK